MKATPTESAANDHGTGYGVIVEPGTLRLERVLPGPIERVWSYLAESDKRGQWFAYGDLEPRVGGRIKLTFRNSETSGDEPVPEKYRKYEGMSFDAKITRFEPPRLLAYTWGADPETDSEVIFELTPQGKDVRFVLTHRRLPSRKELLSVAGGWHSHADALVEILNGRAPRNFWSKHLKISAEYERRVPHE